MLSTDLLFRGVYGPGSFTCSQPNILEGNSVAAATVDMPDAFESSDALESCVAGNAKKVVCDASCSGIQEKGGSEEDSGIAEPSGIDGSFWAWSQEYIKLLEFMFVGGTLSPMPRSVLAASLDVLRSSPANSDAAG
jgi:hypothetical protein